MVWKKQQDKKDINGLMKLYLELKADYDKELEMYLDYLSDKYE